MFKLRATALALVMLCVTGVSSVANAGASANVGLVSDYYFRGANLGDAGVYAGADYDVNGFFAGTWVIDDGDGANDGLETDFYFGYGMELESYSWSVGYNRYEYTYTSDYEDEVQFLFSAGIFSFEGDFGELHDEESDPTVDTDYTHIALGLSGDVFGVTVGSTDVDDDPAGSYDYIEFSAGGEINGFDVSVAIGDASYDDGDPGPYMYLDVSKAFDF
ncbi:MAG: hypothetical protein JXA04_06395 [Gammaproteobacteria bacterium]|nr:hypothetical protein [Gammaproteobacteria bacterium]